MVIKGGGYTLELDDDIQTTTKKDVAGQRLEDTPVTSGNCDTPDNDGVSVIREQYEAFLTDPRRI